VDTLRNGGDSVNSKKCASWKPGFVLILSALACLSGCAGVGRQSTSGRVLNARDPEYQRAYVLYVPSHYRQEQRYPLLVLCHDEGILENASRLINDWQSLAEKQGFLLAAPDLQRTRGFSSDNRSRDQIVSDDEGFFLSLVRSIRGAYTVDDMRVFLCGSGTGAFPALYVGLRHPDLFRAVSVRYPDLQTEWLDPCVPFLDPHQPIQVLRGSGDLTGKKDSEACVTWLRDHELNSTVLEHPGARRRDPASVFAFVSQVLRQQPWIRIQVSDNATDDMVAAFRARTSLPAAKLRWDFGDGSTSTEAAPSHKYARPGRYTVTLSIGSSGEHARVRRVEVRIPRVRLGAKTAPANP
jgi:hypothetical protein